MKDYEALSSLYILSDTGIGGVGAWIDNHILFKLAKSGDCHTTNRKGIEKMMRNVGFTVTDSRQIQGMIRRIRATLSLWRRR